MNKKTLTADFIIGNHFSNIRRSSLKLYSPEGRLTHVTSINSHSEDFWTVRRAVDMHRLKHIIYK